MLLPLGARAKRDLERTCVALHLHFLICKVGARSTSLTGQLQEAREGRQCAQNLHGAQKQAGCDSGFPFPVLRTQTGVFPTTACVIVCSGRIPLMASLCS